MLNFMESKDVGFIMHGGEFGNSLETQFNTPIIKDASGVEVNIDNIKQSDEFDEGTFTITSEGEEISIQTNSTVPRRFGFKITKTIEDGNSSYSFLIERG